MKVLILNPSFIPVNGGVENSIHNMVECFLNKGWSVDVLTGGDFEDMSPEVVKGANCYRYKRGSFFSMFLCLNKLVDDDVSFILSRHFIFSFLTSLFVKKSSVFLVPAMYRKQNIIEHDGLTFKFKYHFFCLLEVFALRNVRHCLVFSEEMKSQVSEVVGSKPISVVNPGVDSTKFKAFDCDFKKRFFKSSLNISEDCKVILFVGRLVSVKNVSILIEAVSNLPENYLLVVVGDGPLLNVLIDEARGLGVIERVRFLGRKEDVDFFYKVADIFCMPSYYEPFGQVLLEATSSSLPVVAFDSELYSFNTATNEIYGGFPRLITMVRSNSAVALSGAILRALDNGVPSNELKAFLDNYRWGSLVDKIIGIAFEEGGENMKGRGNG